MILTEKEGKDLLAKAGCQIPASFLVTTGDPLPTTLPFPFPVFVKAQVFHGNRGLQGLIRKADTLAELNHAVADIETRLDQFSQPIRQLLIEQAAEVQTFEYLSVGYDVSLRRLVARWSPEGGEGMDERGASVQTFELSVGGPPLELPPRPELLDLVQKLWKVLLDNDALLVEINPLARLSTGEYVCLDAKIELEDSAEFRHVEWESYPERSALGRPPTPRELAAYAIAKKDHRGAAGESFIELPGGTIGVLASGGGASTLVMDELVAQGFKPANYVEYSGNPPREKVKELSDVVLSIPNLEALFVVGSNANFTDIYETLGGVVDSLLESSYQSGFVVLIRRGGPRWEEGFAMVKERLEPKGYRVFLFGPTFPVIDTVSELKKIIGDPKQGGAS